MTIHLSCLHNKYHMEDFINLFCQLRMDLVPLDQGWSNLSAPCWLSMKIHSQTANPLGCLSISDSFQVSLRFHIGWRLAIWAPLILSQCRGGSLLTLLILCLTCNFNLSCASFLDKLHICNKFLPLTFSSLIQQWIKFMGNDTTARILSYLKIFSVTYISPLLRIHPYSRSQNMGHKQPDHLLTYNQNDICLSYPKNHCLSLWAFCLAYLFYMLQKE